MPYMIGFFVGSLALVAVLSLIIRSVAGRWLSRLATLIVADVGSLAIATVVAGFGMAHGGPPVFGTALLSYLPAALVAAIIDLVRWKMAQTENSAEGNELSKS